MILLANEIPIEGAAEPLDEQPSDLHSMMDDMPGEPEGDGDYTVYPPLHGDEE